MEEKKQRGIKWLWIGGSDLDAEGTWKWTDCSPWKSTFWKSGEPDNEWGGQNCLEVKDNRMKGWNDQVCVLPARFLCSQTICAEKSQPDIWSSPAFLAAGASVLVFLLVLLLVVLFCAMKMKRNKRNEANVAHSDENPVYGTYFDPDPKAEVADGNTYYKIMYSDS